MQQFMVHDFMQKSLYFMRLKLKFKQNTFILSAKKIITNSKTNPNFTGHIFYC